MNRPAAMLDGADPSELAYATLNRPTAVLACRASVAVQLRHPEDRSGGRPTARRGDASADPAAPGGLAATPPVTTAAARVRMVEAIMCARLGDPLTVAALARAVGVGPRALQIAFRTHRGATPREVLNGLRLERARERLNDPLGTGSVAEAARACGVTHCGRFAAAYRARFGESPSETLRRARQ